MLRLAFSIELVEISARGFTPEPDEWLAHPEPVEGLASAIKFITKMI